MGEMKSAREIALEKVDKLGKLTEEEVKRQKDEERTLWAKGLAGKFLDGLALDAVVKELDKHDKEEREFRKSVLVTALTEAIQLGQITKSERSLEGICCLREDKRIVEIAGEIRDVCHQYEQAEESKKAEIDTRGREKLHQLRISGSAIKAVNPTGSSEYQEDQQTSTQSYEEKLRGLKASISPG